MRVLILLTIIQLTFLSCGKGDEGHALESLIGKWSITQTYFEKGDRVELGSIPDTSFTQSNINGFIDFKSESSVSYEYMVNGDLFKSENSDWSIDSETRKNGFINSTAYFIIIEEVRFEIQFGDRTSDSHVDATNAQLIYTDNINNIGPYEIYQLELRKD